MAHRSCGAFSGGGLGVRQQDTVLQAKGKPWVRLSGEDLQTASGREGRRESLKCQAKTLAFSWQRKIMKGSEQENNTIMIPVIPQEYSPGNGMKDTGAAVTGGQGTGHKAVADVELQGTEAQS